MSIDTVFQATCCVASRPVALHPTIQQRAISCCILNAALQQCVIEDEKLHPNGNGYADNEIKGLVQHKEVSMQQCIKCTIIYSHTHTHTHTHTHAAWCFKN